MPLPFQRTLRSLERERGAHAALLTLGPLLLLGCWVAWMTQARVPIYVQSSAGRLEVSAKTHRAASAAGGRVSSVRVELGESVSAGQPLLHLDSSVEARRLEEARAQLSALEVRHKALQSQLAAESRVQLWQARANEVTLARVQVARSEAEQASTYRLQLQEISADLRREDLISHLEALQAVQDVSASRLRVTAAEADLSKQRVDNRYAEETQAARVAGLVRQLSDLEALGIAAVAAIGTAQAQLERSIVRAPVAGRIGSLAPLEIGDVVREGDFVATVIPHERIRVIADFAPADAMGRIQPGQQARIRLSGFSVLEYGTLRAVVSQVAREPQRGQIRVELALADAGDTRLPVQHGLPGSIEVRLESAVPWRLLLRNLGPAASRADVPVAPGEQREGRPQ
jgi:membrane fusion protein (multidrug efflux system)